MFPQGFYPSQQQERLRTDASHGDLQHLYHTTSETHHAIPQENSYVYGKRPTPPMFIPPPGHQEKPTTTSKDEPCNVMDSTLSKSTTQQWSCDACDVFLDSQRALDAHLQSHQTCTACSFSASPKVVKAHYEAVHGKFSGSGFKSVIVSVPGCPVQRFRICVGNRPEDIREWIAERKRRFPRRQNGKGKDGGDASSGKTEKSENKTGLSALLGGYGSSSSSDEDSEDEQQKEPQPRNLLSESITVTTTENTTECNGTDSPETMPRPETEEKPPSYRTRPCHYFVRNGSCRNGDNCMFLHERHAGSKPRNEPHQKRQKVESSLLQKLLRNDIRREDTLTLRLIDFIVETDFLSTQCEPIDDKQKER